jgi:competence protein ComEC
VWNLRAGQSLVWRPGGARLDVLNPLPEDPPDAMSADRNSHSLVLRLQWRRATLLFTGDADRAAESRLLDRLAAPGLRSQVLKVSHHGSEGATSAQWLAAIRPRVAVISCGRQNRYGHPHRNALARLAAAGARIHRTDLQGALVVESDGKRLWITPCAPPTLPPDH